ncbi:hypothetical protein BHE74_00007711 [Ensete ventricosum]|nr:hypothetical protein BHE74_00007711 [Ensete ventricosum]
MGITGSFSSGHVEALEVPPAEKQEPREKKSRCRHRLTDFGKCSNGAEECLLVLYEYAPLVSMPGHGPATVTPSVKKRTQGYIDFTPFDNGMAELLSKISLVCPKYSCRGTFSNLRISSGLTKEAQSPHSFPVGKHAQHSKRRRPCDHRLLFGLCSKKVYRTKPNLNRRARQYAGTRLRSLNRGVFGCRFKIRDSTDHEINERLRNTDAQRSPWLSASHGLSSVILHINVRKPQKRQREVSES